MRSHSGALATCTQFSAQRCSACDLRAEHVDLYIARDIGQVADVLRSAIDPEATAHTFPTVAAATEAAVRKPGSGARR
jgi:hypothetical protein